MNRTVLNVLTWGTVASAVVGALGLAYAVDLRQFEASPSSRQASLQPGTGSLRAQPTGASVGLDTLPWGMARSDARP